MNRSLRESSSCVAKVQEAAHRILRRGRRRAVGAVRLGNPVRDLFGGRRVSHGLLKHARVWARLGRRQDKKLVGRVKGNRVGSREDEETVSGSVGVHFECFSRNVFVCK